MPAPILCDDDSARVYWKEIACAALLEILDERKSHGESVTTDHFNFVKALPHCLYFDVTFRTFGFASYCPCGRFGTAWRQTFGLSEEVAGVCASEDEAEDSNELDRVGLLKHVHEKVATGDIVHEFLLISIVVLFIDSLNWLIFMDSQ